MAHRQSRRARKQSSTAPTPSLASDSPHSAHAFNGILSRELFSVAVDKSRERDYTIRRDDGDIVRPDLGILVELAPYGVM
jgi:hypothetical protein